jgi:hypothetical protein
MNNYIQLVRRHEVTAKGADGKKLDRPTPEGFKRAYERGMELREMYPSHTITAKSSPKNRTQIAAAAWLLGADVVPAEVETREELGVIRATSEQRDGFRNASDQETQTRMLYDEFREVTTESGLKVARYLLANVQDQPRSPTVDLSLTHGPLEDAAYLLMTGQEVSYESVMANGGMMPEGTGFDFQVKKDGILYVAEIKLNDNIHEVELEELEARLQI